MGLLSPLALALAALLAVAASSALAAVDANQASAAECPNEALRAENNSFALPDCRAYEMVSPAKDAPNPPSTTSTAADSSS